jgi:large subunit ribosomal protein L3
VLSGMLGKKIGMTHLFGEAGELQPVTVLEIGPCVVTQLRTPSTDGYEAVQLGYGHVKQLNKPARGHLKNLDNLRYLREFEPAAAAVYEVGQTLDVRQFFPGETVHVSARSKGRGFQGVVKRYGFAGGPKSHGQKDRHRAPGSIGGTTFPGRVFKGKKMPGHMGNTKITVRNLHVVSVDPQRNLLMVSGAVPGSRNALVTVLHADMVSAAKAYEEQMAAGLVESEAPEEVPVEAPIAEEAPEQPGAGVVVVGADAEPTADVAAVAVEEESHPDTEADAEPEPEQDEQKEQA